MGKLLGTKVETPYKNGDSKFSITDGYINLIAVHGTWIDRKEYHKVQSKLMEQFIDNIPSDVSWNDAIKRFHIGK